MFKLLNSIGLFLLFSTGCVAIDKNQVYRIGEISPNPLVAKFDLANNTGWMLHARPRDSNQAEDILKSIVTISFINKGPKEIVIQKSPRKLGTKDMIHIKVAPNSEYNWTGTINNFFFMSHSMNIAIPENTFLEITIKSEQTISLTNPLYLVAEPVLY